MALNELLALQGEDPHHVVTPPNRESGKKQPGHQLPFVLSVIELSQVSDRGKDPGYTLVDNKGNTVIDTTDQTFHNLMGGIVTNYDESEEFSKKVRELRQKDRGKE